MKVVKVSTQAGLDTALASRAGLEIWIVGAGEFVLRDTPERHWVRASGSSQVTASGSSQVRAYDSSQVRASGSSQVTAYDSSQVRATKFVAVTRHGTMTHVEGGVQIVVPPIRTAEDWCEYYGIEVVLGIATLYKAVGKNYQSARGGDYTPGTVPVALDWDGGKQECGGGLHFSPRPVAALRFAPESTTFVACPVRLTDMRAPSEHDSYPEKIKARGCASPVYACDIDGTPLAVAEASV